MNIEQAVFKSRVQRIVGTVIIFGGALFYFVSLLFFLYRHAEQMGQQRLLWQLGHMLQNLVAGIYNATHPYIGFFWDHAPTLLPDDPFSYGNLLFLGLVGAMITGKQLVRSGRHLRQRVDRQLERIEELQWRQSANSQTVFQQAGPVSYDQASMPSSGERDWWQEPLGIIGLSIISGYVVAVLAKFTNML